MISREAWFSLEFALILLDGGLWSPSVFIDEPIMASIENELFQD